MPLPGKVRTTGKWRSHQLPSKCRRRTLTTVRTLFHPINLNISLRMKSYRVPAGNLFSVLRRTAGQLVDVQAYFHRCQAVIMQAGAWASSKRGGLRAKGQSSITVGKDSKDGEDGARGQPDAAYDRTRDQSRGFSTSRLTPGRSLGSLGRNRWEMRAPTTESPLPAET